MKFTKFKNLALLVFTLTSIQSFSQSKINKKQSTQSSSQYSEKHALECIEDYYEFYNADECYSDPKVRRVSNNVFYVSVKYCSGGKEICYKKENIGSWDNPLYVEVKNDFFWHSKVLVLTCTSKTKYKVTIKY
jgi:hypothetical protein